MRILLTGGAGYIGQVMTRYLLTEGHEVRVSDDMLYRNGLDSHSGLEVIVANITDKVLMKKAILSADVVIHLAAIVGDQACDLDRERAVLTNYVSTVKLAQLAADARKPFVFFSTCSVYGSGQDSAVSEEGSIGPLSLYASTKLEAEQELMKLDGQHLIFRLGTVFGFSPRMRFDLVVNRMVGQAVQDGKISVFGGAQYRPFIHVGDVVSNTLRAVESGAEGLFNLGGENYTIREISEKVRSRTGCEVIQQPEKQDLRNYAVDSSKARKVWGAKFFTSVDAGIGEISDCFKKGLFRSYDEPIYDNAQWLRASHR